MPLAPQTVVTYIEKIRVLRILKDRMIILIFEINFDD